MRRIPRTLACWDYDRVAALRTGEVRPDGIDLLFLAQPVEETFFRMLRNREFDAAEMSLSSYVVSLARKDPAFVAIPVFPSRFFRHSGIYVSAKSGIRKPSDLKGKRVGVPEYQMTAPVWIRGILADEYGVRAEDVEYLTGGEEEPGREEKLKLDLPKKFKVGRIGPKQTLARMLAAGEIDALYAPRAPSTFATQPRRVRRLFPDFERAELAYWRRTRIFPIMHTVVLRRELYEKQRWIAQSLAKAFAQAQQKTYRDLGETAALKAMLPWAAASAEQARKEMGQDWWPYGFEANRKVLETFLRYHHEQGLSPRRLEPEALFAPETLETFKV